MPSHHAYVDAYGDTGLSTQKTGTSIYFVVAAVLVDGEHVRSVAEAADSIRAKHFQSGEIKSSKVGPDLDRRLRVLEDLTSLDFRVHADAIDKRQVDPNTGMIYKRSFLKYLHRQLYRKLVRSFPNISVLVDEHGSPEFMAGFETYIREREKLDLFQNSTFAFASSESQPLVQVADFIAGSIAHMVDPGKMVEGCERIMEVLGDRVLSVDEWPPERRIYSRLSGGDVTDELDEMVERVCREQTLVFLEEHAGATQRPEKFQFATLRYLFFYSRFVNPHSYVPTKLIRYMLEESEGEEVGEQYFRTNVMAKLRDAGVVIASGHRGYKIPVCATDLGDFVAHTCGIALPMIDRLRKARNLILRASMGKLDILGEDQFQDVRQLCDGSIKGAS